MQYFYEEDWGKDTEEINLRLTYKLSALTTGSG